MKLRNFWIVVLLLLIIFSGILRSQVGLVFTSIIQWAFEIVNIDYESLENSMGQFAKDGSANSGLGIFGYYFTYLCLHFCLIHVLFYDVVKVRNRLIIILSLLTFGLGSLSLVFKILELDQVSRFFYSYFLILTGRPLILFLIEGGGFIYKYVDTNLSD